MSKKQYEAIVSHHNGCGYSSDGEEWFDVDTPDDVDADTLIEMYNKDTEGDPCDVNSIVEVYAVTKDIDGEDVRELVRTVNLRWSAGEAAQDDCTVIASQTNEYTTSYVGVRPAKHNGRDYVRWTNNGGFRGAHDCMQGDGEWRETYELPEEINAGEFLRLALEYGYDVDEDKHDLCGLVGDSLRNGELDNETDTAYCLDDNGTLITIEAHTHRIGTRHVLLWTDCDGGGIDDVCIRDWSDEYMADYAEEIADGVGEVVDVESGCHYTNLGLQYQPSTGYDHDGYEVVIKRRD